MMDTKIFIKPASKGWVVLSQDGKRLSGDYDSANQALEIARTLAAAGGAEIVIYPNEESFAEMRKRRRKKQETKNKSAHAE